jgi:hypothetical protein
MRLATGITNTTQTNRKGHENGLVFLHITQAGDRQDREI